MAAANHILLIEDDALSGELVQYILENAGFSMTWVPDGRAAVSHIEASDSPIDLVITELVLPYLDGWEVLSYLRSVDSWRTVPVVFLTDSDDESDIVRAFDLGADDYLSKPFRPVELTARVRHQLTLQSQRRHS